MYRSFLFGCSLIFSFGLCFSLTSASTQPPQKDWRQGILDDIDFIHHTFEVSYAPVVWKQELFSCNFNDEVLKAKKRISNMKYESIRDIHGVLRNLMHSVRDYHVSIQFISTEKASLPFKVKEAQGKYFFSYIDEENINSDLSFPFAVGDELLIIDGEPVDKVVTKLRKRTSINHLLTDKAFAAMKLTGRFGVFGDKVPYGYVTLIGRKAGTAKKAYGSLPWKYTPEFIKNPLCKNLVSKEVEARVIAKAPKMEKNKQLLLNSSLCNAQFSSLDANFLMDNAENADRCALGARRSFVPTLGKIIWESEEDEPFHAYTFFLPSGKIAGYVRIPSYRAYNFEYFVNSFAKLMGKYQKQTDILIIDQVNNPGGVLLYLYGLVSALSDKPLKPPKHRMLLTHGNIEGAWSDILSYEGIEDDERAREVIGDTLMGYPVDKHFIDQIISFSYELIQEWAEGRRLTSPIAFFGIDKISVHKNRYKKPILILINELDISGGDFFPAILQDSKRAKLLGTRTAGAGGCVSTVRFPNMSGISAFALTETIAERTNDEPIENLGVVPDYPYEITPEDLEFGYKKYKEKIVSTLELMLKGSN